MKKIPIRQLGSALQELSVSEQFKIRRVEEIVGDKNLVHDLHRHDFFFILVIEKGEGNHEIDFTPFRVFIALPKAVYANLRFQGEWLWSIRWF